MHLRYSLIFLTILTACEPEGDERTWSDDDTGATDTADPVSPVGPLGFVGSPCETVADCDFEGAECITDGFPDGICTQACDMYCPDRAGHPVTFCGQESDLPPSAAALGDGACLARCDLGLFPETGCREGYGCAVVGRANEATEQYVCMPGETSDFSQCVLDLADRGVRFEVTVWPDRSPDSHPNLTCHIDDPIILHSPILGVDLDYYDGSSSSRLPGSCALGHAVADTVLDVKERGATAVRHIGTVNCRVISGTSTLSRHAYGDAIDIYGFDLDDGSTYTLIDDWVHDDPTPSTAAGRFLYDAAYRWYDFQYWNIILTPDYNAAHDNHFHIDLTPGSHYIGASDGSPVVVQDDFDCGGPAVRELYGP